LHAYNFLKINVALRVAENNLNFGNSFEEVRETIKNNRIYINQVENFEIKDTCAFTVETRLADINNPELPNVFGGDQTT
jgi:hypothetical protein